MFFYSNIIRLTVDSRLNGRQCENRNGARFVNSAKIVGDYTRNEHIMTEQQNSSDASHASPQHHAPQVSKLLKPVAFAIILLLAFYGFLLSQGYPQQWRDWSNDHDAYYEYKFSAYKSVDKEEGAFYATAYGNKITWTRNAGDQNFRIEWSKEGFTDEFVPDESNSVRLADRTPNSTLSADMWKLIGEQSVFRVRVVKLDGAGENAGVVAVANVVALSKDLDAEQLVEAVNVRTPHPPFIMVTPFVTLLLCIAFLPLIPATAHWWENNMNRFLVAGTLGLLTLLYYLIGCTFPIEEHWPAHGYVDPAVDGNFAVAKTVFLNAILYEFFPFIVLLFSLFVISGGIRIAGNLRATPFVNSVILLIGGVLASFIGTTGAAVLLIRLLLETNKERKFKVHTVIFFIFIVCNCGGCLTPLGDPPLFLGYLRGVPFEWTFFLWPEWMFVNLSLLALYFAWDSLWFYRRESEESKREDDENVTSISITGWMLNIPLLLGVVAAVAFLDPSRPVPGTEWYPYFYLREAVQLSLAATSLLFSSYFIRKANAFNFLAIGEVAALFFGIFLCMQAPLQILGVKGEQIVTHAEQQTGVSKEQLFFWSTGSLSAVLDNAPTYVVFFDTARTLTPNDEASLRAVYAHRYVYDKETGYRQYGDDRNPLEEIVRDEEIGEINEEGEFVGEFVKKWQYIVWSRSAGSLAYKTNAEVQASVNDDGEKKWRRDNGRWVARDGSNAVLVPVMKEKGLQIPLLMWLKGSEKQGPEIIGFVERTSEWRGGEWRCFDGVRKLVPLGGSTGSRGFIEHALLIAISLGAVFCGALTYIGNGPNFMIKAIAEHDGVKMPSFFGYIGYSAILLLPLLILATLIFLPLFP